MFSRAALGDWHNCLQLIQNSYETICAMPSEAYKPCVADQEPKARYHHEKTPFSTGSYHGISM